MKKKKQEDEVRRRYIKTQKKEILCTHGFLLFRNSYAWTADYGCADDAEQFKYLIKYSPLHNVRTGQPYPALLLVKQNAEERKREEKREKVKSSNERRDA